MRTRVPKSLALLAGVILATQTARAEYILFNEVMYNPPGSLPEYIEIENNSHTPFDIAGWKFTEGIGFEFPLDLTSSSDTYSFLRDREKIIVTNVDEASFRAAYPSTPPNSRIFGPYTGALNNGGETVTLEDKNGVVMTTLDYRDGGNWPLSPDGAGHSLVLVSRDGVVDDWRNWRPSASRLGTPGADEIVVAEESYPNPEVDLSTGIPVINYGDTWRFRDNNTNVPVNEPGWNDTGFNDTGWGSGPGLFGFETSSLPAPGIQTGWTNSSDAAQHMTYFARKEFNYSGATTGVTLTIDQIVDDGVIYYLNGEEFGSVRANSGSEWKDSAAGNVNNATEELDVLSRTTGGSLVLNNGVNVLAAQVHQVSNTSSDVVFGARLKVAAPSTPSVVINEVLPAGAGTGFVEFYNPGASPVNLQNHYLSDAGGNLTKFRITSSLTVPAMGFASVGFTESNLAVSSPTNVYLTASDGTSIVNAVSTPMPLDGRSLGRKPSGGSSWFLFAGATRDSANASASDLADSLALSEVHWNASNQIDWVEIHNKTNASVSTDGFFISSQSDFSDKVPLSGAIPANGYASVDTVFPGGDLTIYITDASNNVVAAAEVTRPAQGRDALQAFPGGSSDWFAASSSSRNAANNPPRTTSVVINEIMYDPPSDHRAGEFIELYNKGGSTVNLSGWRFSDGINFTFPNGTSLGAGQYLVVAADSAWISSVYGGIDVVGDWSGSLANGGELLRLVDDWGNLADKVDYNRGGDWPELADGDGASMELKHPDMDNAISSAWDDSDESNKGQFQTFTYTDTFRQLTTRGGPSDYKELHFHLVGDAHLVLKNISMRQNGTGANILTGVTNHNNNTSSPVNSSANGWLIQGTHWQSYMDNGELNLISDGHGDNKCNRAEIDATGMTSGRSYTVSFDAKWIYGKPRLIMQTWDHSIGEAFLVPVPNNLGTPGSANSTALPAAPPEIASVTHSPAVPTPGQSVTITAKVTSSSPIASVQVRHRSGNTNTPGNFSTATMFDNGISGGDEIANDGIYSAIISNYTSNDNIGQFYVQANADNGQSSTLPKKGPTWPAMWVVDNTTLGSDLRTQRFIIAQFDRNALTGSGLSATYNYNFERMSNHYFNATFISNERDIYYNCELRKSGSPWTRDGGSSLTRGKIKFPQDKPFRGWTKRMFDNDANGGSRHHNRITRYWLYLLGHEAPQNEYIRHVVNGGNPSLAECTEPIQNDYLDRIYPDGASGELLRIDDQWWFDDGWGRQSQNADWRYKGTTNPIRYHSEWIRRSQETEYDYSAFINWTQIVSNGNRPLQTLERFADTQKMTANAAVRGWIGDWDSLTLNRGKNCYFFRRPTDGKWTLQHWDSDLAFRNTGETFVGNLTNIRNYFYNPVIRRYLNYYIGEMLDKYTTGSPRLARWLAEEDNAFGVNEGTYNNWNSGRISRAQQELGAARTAPFNSSAPASTSSATATVTGSAPYNIFTVVIPGHPEAVVEWTSITNYSISGITLATGSNNLTLNGVDRDGNILGTTSVNINKTGNAAPVIDIDASPGSWQLAAGETLELDATASFDPDLTPLAFTWSVSPNNGVTVTEPAPGRVELAFAAPGLYDVTLTATNGAAQSTQVVRQASVYSFDDFASFNEPVLPTGFSTANIENRDNHSPGAWYSLEDRDGALTMKVNRDGAHPLVASGATMTHPYVSRDLPDSTDWSLQTKVSMVTAQTGSFFTGLIADVDNAGDTVRYVFAIDGGDSLTVRAESAGGSLTTVGTAAFDSQTGILRIRRQGNFLLFDQQLSPGEWSQVTSQTLTPGTTALDGGIFTATTNSEEVRLSYDYLLLVDPNIATDHTRYLRITEVMYNPAGGSALEFIELTNIGPAPLDLAGVRFDQGDPFDALLLPAITLDPGEFVVIVSDVAAFQNVYGNGVTIAGTWTGGSLSNSGERIVLRGPLGNIVHDFAYSDSAPWPTQADGSGGSLQVKDPTGDYTDPDNWRVSTDYNGNPGGTGSGPDTRIVINEILSNSEPPAIDYIEFHNPGASAVDISGWWVSDATSNYQKYVFPAATVIPAGGFHVIDETDFNPGAGVNATDFALSSKGDQVYLVEPSGGLPSAFVASQSFDYAPTGETLGSHTNSVGDQHFVLQSAPTPGTANSGPRIGPAVLSEIMYSPAPGGIPFVEIENVSGGPLQLWDPANPTNTWRINGLAFNFPANTTIQTAEVAIIASTDPAAFRAAYPELDPQTLVFGPYAGSLQTDGETLTLQAPDPPLAPDPDPCYYDVDKVTYSPLTPWPAPPAGTGPSLERRFANQYGNDPANWQASSQDGGTPGSSNTPATTPEVKVSTRDIIAFGTVGIDAPSQSFDVSNDGINTLNYSITDDASWLNITPPTGSSTTPVDFQSHTVSFDSDGLPGGVHTATITVSDPTAINSPQTIDVSITVSAPEIVLSNAALQFAAATNEPIAATTVQVWNGVEDTTLNYSVASDVAWLSITPGNGNSSGPGDRQDHTLSVSTAGLPNGQYTGHITVADPIATNNSQVLTVTLNVTDDVLVNLDARSLSTGPLANWSNLGLLGGSFTAERDTPSVTTIDGVRGVTLDGSRDWFVGPVAPPAVTGNNPHTIEAWIYNPTISPSETIAAWSREAWVEGTALGLRTDNLVGADFTGEIPGPGDSHITSLNVDSEALGAANGIDLSGDNFDWVFTFKFYDADGKFSFTENFDDKVLLEIDQVVSNTDSTVVDDGTPHSDSGWNVRTFADYNFASSGWFSATLYLSEDGGGAQSANGIGIGYSNAASTGQESQFGGIGYDPAGGSGNPATFDLDASTGNRFGSLLSDGSSNNMRFNHGTSADTGAALRDGGADLGWSGDQEGGIWTHVSLAYDGAGNTSVYTNGVLSQTVSHNALSLQEDSTDDSQLRFVIGNHNRADGTRADASASSMTVSVLRIYDRELSAGAIENNYNLDAASFGREPTQTVDTDADGLADADEITLGTDPNNPDSDGDGMLDGAEVFAGTDPLDPNSLFAIISTEPGFLQGLVLITWTSSPGKQYIIQYSTDLQPGNWVDLNGGNPVNGRNGATTTSFADATPGATKGTRLYRVILQIP